MAEIPSSLLKAYKQASADYEQALQARSEAARRRAVIVLEMTKSGMSAAEVAEALGISRQRVYQLADDGMAATATRKARR